VPDALRRRFALSRLLGGLLGVDYRLIQSDGRTRASPR
jgi:hypothetical protein